MKNTFWNWVGAVSITVAASSAFYSHYDTHVWVSTSKTVGHAISTKLVDREKLAAYLSARADEVAQKAIDEHDIKLMCKKDLQFLIDHGIDLVKTCNADVVPIK